MPGSPFTHEIRHGGKDRIRLGGGDVPLGGTVLIDGVSSTVRNFGPGTVSYQPVDGTNTLTGSATTIASGASATVSGRNAIWVSTGHPEGATIDTN
jgi:hypothetical protein